MGGDFNTVLKYSKRYGEHFSSVCANEFKEELNKLNMEDLPLVGAKWTWTNQRSSPSSSRIEWFLISHDCLFLFSGLCLRVLRRPIFDHFPICLASNGGQWCPILFRLDKKWLKITMMYGLLGLNCVIEVSMRDELWLWEEICQKHVI